MALGFPVAGRGIVADIVALLPGYVKPPPAYGSLEASFSLFLGGKCRHPGWSPPLPTSCIKLSKPSPNPRHPTLPEKNITTRQPPSSIMFKIVPVTVSARILSAGVSRAATPLIRGAARVSAPVFARRSYHEKDMYSYSLHYRVWLYFPFPKGMCGRTIALTSILPSHCSTTTTTPEMLAQWTRKISTLAPVLSAPQLVNLPPLHDYIIFSAP